MRGGGTGERGPKYEATGETSSCQKHKKVRKTETLDSKMNVWRLRS